ncbi:MAG TPA: hypothetical protein VK211_06820 [Kamptonema sp.]|nr:hypothetical protein [Kamptonema sp.]
MIGAFRSNIPDWGEDRDRYSGFQVYQVHPRNPVSSLISRQKSVLFKKPGFSVLHLPGKCCIISELVALFSSPLHIPRSQAIAFIATNLNEAHSSCGWQYGN